MMVENVVREKAGRPIMVVEDVGGEKGGRLRLEDENLNC